MKSALFVDDETYRHYCFLDAHRGKFDIIDCVTTNEDAIHLLKKYKYDLVSLDYDLTQSEGDGKTTMATAAFICCMEHKPKAVRVHSRNFLAAPRLWQMLVSNGVFSYVCEFGELEKYGQEIAPGTL